jgi:hypothetical protein
MAHVTGGDLRRGPGQAGVKEKEMVVKLPKAILRNRHGLDGDFTRRLKLDQIEPAMGREDLVLGPDDFIEPFLFDANGIPS